MWTVALAIAAATAADEAALEAYADRRLDVTHAQVSTVYAKGYDGSGEFWFVVDGGGRTLDLVAFADVVGDTQVASLARRRGRSSTLAGLGLFGVGIAGGLLAVVSLGGAATEAPGAIGGGAAAVGGFTGGTLMLGGLVRRRHPASAYTEDEATVQVRAHNAALRDELLGPE